MSPANLAALKAANDASQLLDETTSSGLSVRGNMWRYRAIGLYQLHCSAAWTADMEERAARKARRAR